MGNVVQAIWDHAERDPDRDALVGDASSWSYGRLRERASAVASRLIDAGIGPGDRVLLVAPSRPEFAGAYFGILAAGAIALPANTMSTRAELEHLGADAGVSLVMGWSAIEPAPAAAAEALGIEQWPLGPELEEIPAVASAAVVHDAADDDAAVILYTSGTTGRPKGAQLTHGNLIACASSFGAVFEARAGDRFGTALPLFHVFGQAAIMGTALRAGASLSVLERFDADALLDRLRRDRLTVIAGVPTMWNALLHADSPGGAGEFAAVRLAISGGASLPAAILRSFEARFGCAILEGYGLTETTGGSTFNGLRRVRKPGAVGAAIPGGEIAIRDQDGRVLGPGEVGEVTLRGPTVMKGYWNRPESTAEVLSDDGWFATGDLGTLDGDGDLRIVDRKKDLVIHGGYNVYPREVEEVLYAHPDIVEVAVVGVPDEHYGEEVAAVVVLAVGAQLDASAMRAWAKERLSPYKVPRLYHLVEQIPKGPTGKVLKREIDLGAVRAQAQRAAGGSVASKRG